MFKKVITYIFVLILILVLYEIAFSFLKTSHNVNYTIVKEDAKYEINEVYTKKKSNDFYYIIVKNDSSSYLFSIVNNYNKQKNIVKDVINLKINNNISCLVLNLIDDTNSIPICLKDNSLYSYYALSKKYDLSSLDKYVKKYDVPGTKEVENNHSLKVNYGYMDDNEYIALYNLKDVLFFHNNADEFVTFSDQDIYKNVYGYMVGKYYIIPELTGDNPDIYRYIIYDVTKRKIEFVNTLDVPVNKKEVYVNGVYDKSLYLVDKSNKVQYRIDPKAKTMQEVGNANTDGFVYQNGVLSRENMYKLSENEIVFSENTDEYSSIKADKIYPQSNYAYYLKNGSFFKVYNNLLEYPVHLFDTNNANNIKVINDSIYFIDGDKLYKYNDYGLNEIITRDEFKYNFYNIFDVYIN